MINAEERKKELIKILTKASKAYYVDDAPIMTDFEYDKYYSELEELEKSTGIIFSNSPTQKTQGEVLPSLTKVKHSKPMLSCDKTKSVNRIINFCCHKDVLISWKLDGLTIVLKYNNGKLVQAITRGDEGIVGEDVTHNIKVAQNVPLTIPYKEPLEIRGECVISQKRFEEINEGLPVKEKYATARNLAAGSVRQLDSNICKDREIKFIAFALITKMPEIKLKTQAMLFLRNNGFETVDYIFVSENEQNYETKVNDAIESFVPNRYEIPVDGLVAEYNDIEYGDSLGATAHHERKMLALKWPDKQYETIFRGIDYNVTRTGSVSMTAVFDDVNIDGTKVSRALIPNVSYFKKLKLGHGDKIKVFKANMIIPQISENLTKSETERILEVCPCCGEELFVIKPNESEFLVCTNPRCSGRIIDGINYFASKKCMDINGLSLSTITKLYEAEIIKSLVDVLDLPDKIKDDFCKKDIFDRADIGKKTIENLCLSIENSKTTTLDRVLCSLGISNLGRTASRAIAADSCYEVEIFNKKITSGFDFRKLKDVGEVIGNNLCDWFSCTENWNLWQAVIARLVFKKVPNKNVSVSIFSEKKVVITGSFERGGEKVPREKIQELVEQAGGSCGSSVSSKTDFLICGNNAGSKLEKAKGLGISILEEKEFFDIISKI